MLTWGADATDEPSRSSGLKSSGMMPPATPLLSWTCTAGDKAAFETLLVHWLFDTSSAFTTITLHQSGPHLGMPSRCTAGVLRSATAAVAGVCRTPAGLLRQIACNDGDECDVCVFHLLLCQQHQAQQVKQRSVATSHVLLSPVDFERLCGISLPLPCSSSLPPLWLDAVLCSNTCIA